MKIGDEVYVHGYVDEIRKDVIIIRNNGGYFGTVPSEMFYYEEDRNGYGTLNEADTPQTEEICERCIYVRGSPWCQGCNGTPKRWNGEKVVDTPQTETQIETQNSNLTFEKQTDEEYINNLPWTEKDCPWK